MFLFHINKNYYMYPKRSLGVLRYSNGVLLILKKCINVVLSKHK